MISQELTKVLRIFFEYAIGVIFVVGEDSQIYVLFKQDVEEQANDSEDSVEALPLKKITQLDLLVNVIEKFSKKIGDDYVIPAVDFDYEFIGLWNRQEIFRRFDKFLGKQNSIQIVSGGSISQAEKDALLAIDRQGFSKETVEKNEENFDKKNIPEIPFFQDFDSQSGEVGSREEDDEDWHRAFEAIENANTQEDIEEDELNQVEKNIFHQEQGNSVGTAELPRKQDVFAFSEGKSGGNSFAKQDSEAKREFPPSLIEEDLAPLTQSTRKKINEELSKSKLAVATLETLPIPLLALKVDGELLFMNLDWYLIKQQFSDELADKKILDEAKEMIAAKVLQGHLELKHPLRLDFGSADYYLQIKPIQITESLTDTLAQGSQKPKKIITLGYLFWLERYKKHYRDQKDIEFARVKKTLQATTSFAITPNVSANLTKNENFEGKTLPQIVAEIEKQALLWALEQTNGNRSDAAMLLGIPRQTFTYKLQKYTQKRITERRGSRG